MNREWPLTPLGEILEKSEEWIDVNPEKRYKQITVKIWGKGVVEHNEITGAEIAGSKRLKVKAGEFIVSRIDARHGAFGLIPEFLEGAIVTNDFPVFRPKQGQILPKYIDWMSKTRSFVDLCVAASEGTTNRVRLKEDRFLSMQIPLPPPDEQRRIVARIEELAAKVDEARGLRRQSVEEAKKLYSAFLSSVMEPHGEAWKQETVADVIVNIDAGWSPMCDDFPAKISEWGVLKTTSVQWCEFRPNENKALPLSLTPRPELTIQEGDVLVTRAGPRKRVGVVAAVRKTEPFLTISDKLIRIRPDNSKIDYRFLELSLASPFSQQHLVQRKTGLADAQVNISQAILRATPIAYPPSPKNTTSSPASITCNQK